MTSERVVKVPWDDGAEAPDEPAVVALDLAQAGLRRIFEVVPADLRP